MSLLKIITYPNPNLKKVAQPIITIDDEIKTLVANMFETMYYHDGIGLAATQVNIHKRVFVVDLSKDQSLQLCFINPTIVAQDGITTHQEGCLSFPEIFAKVSRSKTVTLEYQNLSGEKCELVADDLLSICLQHELDHLNGITFYDRLSPLAKGLLRNKLKKIQEI